jgi:hypothetical protein
LGLIGLTVQWAAVFQFPDAQVRQHAFPFFQLEPASTDVARDLQPFWQVLLIIPAVKFVLMLGVDLHHHYQDCAPNVLGGIGLVGYWHAVPSVLERVR